MIPQKVQTEVHWKIEEGIREGTCVSAWGHIKKLLEQHGLAWRQRVPPEAAAVSPVNRGGHGVTGRNVQTHGHEMLSIGFSKERARDVVAVDYDRDEDVKKL